MTAVIAPAAQAATGAAAEPVRKCVCGMKKALNEGFQEGWGLW